MRVLCAALIGGPYVWPLCVALMCGPYVRPLCVALRTVAVAVVVRLWPALCCGRRRRGVARDRRLLVGSI
jgi:hypothetical protein